MQRSTTTHWENWWELSYRHSTERINKPSVQFTWDAKHKGGSFRLSYNTIPLSLLITMIPPYRVLHREMAESVLQESIVVHQPPSSYNERFVVNR